MANKITIMYLHRNPPLSEWEAPNTWETGITISQELPSGIVVNYVSTLFVYGESEEDAKMDIARIVAANVEGILAENQRIEDLLR